MDDDGITTKTINISTPGTSSSSSIAATTSSSSSSSCSFSSPSSSSSSSYRTNFEVYVSKDTFKFNAAHFVAFPGFRERLHGHNYRVSVRMLGGKRLGPDGYVLDFGEVKEVTKKVCKRLNERFICPMYSNVLQINHLQQQQQQQQQPQQNGGGSSSSSTTTTTTAPYIELICEDGSKFLFPRDDCALLPIMHATAEELAIYVWGQILRELSAEYLQKRNIHTMEIIIAEAMGQEATFRHEIPTTTTTTTSEDDNDVAAAAAVSKKPFDLDVRAFIMEGKIVEAPCASETENHYVTQQQMRQQQQQQQQETKNSI